VATHCDRSTKVDTQMLVQYARCLPVAVWLVVHNPSTLAAKLVAASLVKMQVVNPPCEELRSLNGTVVIFEESMPSVGIQRTNSPLDCDTVESRYSSDPTVANVTNDSTNTGVVFGFKPDSLTIGAHAGTVTVSVDIIGQ